MTQKQSVHVHGVAQQSPTGIGPCQVYTIATAIMSAFSDFDVSETGSGMPCYCIQTNINDAISGAMFQAEIEEVRTSHDPFTALANHQIHYTLTDKTGKKLLDTYKLIGRLRTDGDFLHPFGTANQDTVAFYMSVFPDPRNRPEWWKKFIQFFWYQNVGGGTVADPDPAEIIGTSSITIGNWFQPTDLNMDLVAIEGDVQFDDRLSALVTLGEQPHMIPPGITTAASVGTSPCATQYPSETSNAVSELITLSAHSSLIKSHI